MTAILGCITNRLISMIDAPSPSNTPIPLIIDTTRASPQSPSTSPPIQQHGSYTSCASCGQPPNGVAYGLNIPHSFTDEILRDQVRQNFIQKEIKLILSGIISITVSVGCIILIGITGGDNCALNNGAFAILSAIGGGWLTLLSTSTASSTIAKHRRTSSMV